MSLLLVPKKTKSAELLGDRS